MLRYMRAKAVSAVWQGSMKLKRVGELQPACALIAFDFALYLLCDRFEPLHHLAVFRAEQELPHSPRVDQQKDGIHGSYGGSASGNA